MGLLGTILGMGKSTEKLKEMLANGALIIDVRTPSEFQGGHVVGAKNYPLQTIEKDIKKLKALNKPLVLCCASGNRSGMATSLLQKHGLECENGGSWLTVNNWV